jgi:molybdate-binding protein
MARQTATVRAVAERYNLDPAELQHEALRLARVRETYPTVEDFEQAMADQMDMSLPELQAQVNTISDFCDTVEHGLPG